MREVHEFVKLSQPWAILVMTVIFAFTAWTVFDDRLSRLGPSQGTSTATKRDAETQSAMTILRKEVEALTQGREREQALREALLYAMASDRLDLARSADQAQGTEAPLARKGQRRALEAMAKIGADITGIDANRAYLANAALAKARLARADFYQADLSHADLTEATLTDANLSVADLSSAKLNGADLSKANLFRADMRGADFSGAKLKDARLQSANLQFASLKDADLTGADLTGADLTGARDVAQDKLDTACGNGGTILPTSRYGAALSLKPCEEKKKDDGKGD